MAEAVTTRSFRRRLAAHFATGEVLPVIASMAFGDGGHDADGKAVPPDSSRDTLYSETLRKDLETIVQEDEFSVTGVGRVSKEELVGRDISEAGLLDAEGNLLGIKTFARKIKDADEEYEVRIKLVF